jgi:hypothetical protein
LQGNTHPFAVIRFAELDRWAAEGDYREILAGHYARREDDPSASPADEFKAAARSYQDSWSRSSDPLIGAARVVAETAVGTGQRLFGGSRGNGGSRGSGGESSPSDDDS